MPTKPLLPFCIAALLLATPWVQAAPTHELQQLGPHAYGRLADDVRSANSAVFVGEQAALVVDPGLTPAIAQTFLERVRARIGKIPIRYVVLTHWHPDHALGALCVLDQDVQLIAHPFTAGALRRQAPQVLAELAQRADSASEKQALEACRPRFPDRLVVSSQTIDLGGLSVQVLHPGHAHTTGDLVVWSASERVLATGDVFMHAASPDMGEADPVSWLQVLDDLVALHPEHVVAGHFGLSNGDDLVRFRGYMRSLVAQVRNALDNGVDMDALETALDLHQFADFGQFPQYNATFAGNARDVAHALQAATATGGEYTVLARLKVGQNPHQIAFSPAADTAYVAAAGSDRITLIDTQNLSIKGHLDAPGVPLGVIALGDGKSLAVSRFQSDSLARYRLADGHQTGQLKTGGSPSLIQGPFAGQQYLITAEKANKLWLFNAENFTMAGEFDTGNRPFPAAATSDGRRAFVPNYDDGSVTVIDLKAQRVVTTVSVGKHPSGGVVLPGDALYAVVVRGENRIALLDIASSNVVGSIRQGIGESPFSIVLATDGRHAFVNNTASHDVSVIDLPDYAVSTRIAVGEIPIVMNVHPDGKTLWVSCEGSHEVDVVRIP